MEYVNVFGLIFVAIIMIPNVVFAMKCRDGFANPWKNKFVEGIEQIGRFSCLTLMIVNPPGTCWGWRSDEAFAAYLLVDAALVVLYGLIWIICFRKKSLFRALALSLIPSALFLFSGIMLAYIPLIAFSVLFGITHIAISYKSATFGKNLH